MNLTVKIGVDGCLVLTSLQGLPEASMGLTLPDARLIALWFTVGWEGQPKRRSRSRQF